MLEMNKLNINFQLPPLQNLEVIDASNNDIVKFKNLQLEPQNWLLYDGINKKNIFYYLEICNNEGCNIFFSNLQNKKNQEKVLLNLNKIFPRSNKLLAFCTSGSTGRFKIIIHTLESLISSARDLIRHYPAIVGGVTYSGFPLNYMAGVLNNTIVAMLANSSIILDEDFSFSTAYRLKSILNQHNVTWSWLSPGVINSFLISGQEINASNKLKLVLNATGPILSDKRTLACSRFNAPVLNTYGLSELLFVSGENEVQEEVTIGNPLFMKNVDLYEGRIAIKTDTECEYIFQTGANYELSPIVIERTPQGQFLTQDLGKILKNKFVLKGRADDIIIRNGANISLSLLEQTAESHPQVIHACARINFTSKFEFLEVILEIQDYVEFKESEMRSYMVNLLPKSHLPSKIIIEKLPKLPSGKVDKISIRNETKKE
jgi:acyl-coenzyme A synthetase/AMP-(fatty) acid ligase